MLGAIVGDIVGSRFEWDNYKDKDFDLFDEECCYTDDSVMTLSVCSAFLKANADYTDLSDLVVKSMQQEASRTSRRDSTSISRTSQQRRSSV